MKPITQTQRSYRTKKGESFSALNTILQWGERSQHHLIVEINFQFGDQKSQFSKGQEYLTIVETRNSLYGQRAAH